MVFGHAPWALRAFPALGSPRREHARAGEFFMPPTVWFRFSLTHRVLKGQAARLKGPDGSRVRSEQTEPSTGAVLSQSPPPAPTSKVHSRAPMTPAVQGRACVADLHAEDFRAHPADVSEGRAEAQLCSSLWTESSRPTHRPGPSHCCDWKYPEADFLSRDQRG